MLYLHVTFKDEDWHRRMKTTETVQRDDEMTMEESWKKSTLLRCSQSGY